MKLQNASRLPFQAATREETQLSASPQFCAVIRFSKCQIKSSVRASERRPRSRTETLASSVNVCKYCNKQSGFLPHKRCRSSNASDRRHRRRCCLLSSPLFFPFPDFRLRSRVPDKTVPCWRSESAQQTHLFFLFLSPAGLISFSNT